MRRPSRPAGLVAVALVVALVAAAPGGGGADGGDARAAGDASGKLLSGFEGRADYDFGRIPGGTCTFDVVRARGARTIDHVVVTPESAATDLDLSYGGAAAARDGYVRITVCNPGRRTVDPPTLSFAWLVVRGGLEAG